MRTTDKYFLQFILEIKILKETNDQSTLPSLIEILNNTLEYVGNKKTYRKLFSTTKNNI